MRPSFRRSPNVTPPPRAAALTAPGAASPDLGLEAEILWDRHKGKVIGAMLLALAAILGYTLFLYFRASALAAANTQLSAAKSIDEVKQVIADHPTSIVAGDAFLILSQKQSEAKDFVGAAASARSLIEKFPAHPLANAAWLAVASNLEAAGKLDEADAAYKSASEGPTTDFAVPLALLARANIAKLRGNSAEARRFLDDVMVRFPGSGPAMQAEQDRRFVRVVSTAPFAVPATAPIVPAPVVSPGAKSEATPVATPAAK